MRWFTREWLHADEGDGIGVAYTAHLAAIAPRLHSGAQSLPDIDLHDGQVRRYSLEDGVFAMTVLIGDLEVGYEWLSLRYEGAELIGLPRDGIRRLRLRARRTELLYDEIDLAPGDLFEHRILLWPRRELCIRFSSVAIERRPADDTARR